VGVGGRGLLQPHGLPDPVMTRSCPGHSVTHVTEELCTPSMVAGPLAGRCSGSPACSASWVRAAQCCGCARAADARLQLRGGGCRQASLPAEAAHPHRPAPPCPAPHP
jgi:hypothetical protein